jgi:hypothetical protein
MRRREFLVGGAALSAWAGRARADAEDLNAAAREAWVYALALIEAGRLRAATLGAHPAEGTPGFNSFLHQRRPWTPVVGELSAPETAVLTSIAWVRLGDGAAKFFVPTVQGRYLSVTLLDMYGNTIKVLGRKADGEEAGGEFTVLGPAGKMGMAGYYVKEPRLPPMPMHKVIHAPGPWVWAIARVEAGADGDLADAHAVQDALVIHAKGAAAAPAPSAPLDADWGDYFFAAQKLIEENPPPLADLAFFRRIAQLQLGMDAGFEKARFADMDLETIARGVGEAKTLAFNGRLMQETSGGWMWPKADLGAYGEDFLYRAQTTLATPGAPPADEILLLRAVAPDGGLAFPSVGRYRLTLPGAPPAMGPWSLTLYETTPEGRLVLPDDPTGRYAVGSHTPGLRRRGDRGLDIWIERSDPGGEHADVWLSAPPRGPFALVLRAYRPGDELLRGRYRPGPVEAVRFEAPPLARRHGR